MNPTAPRNTGEFWNAHGARANDLSVSPPPVGGVVRPTGLAGTAGETTKQEIYRRFRRGKSADELARQYGLSTDKIEQIVRETQYQRVFQLPLDYMPSPEFEQPSAGQEREILARMPDGPHTHTAPPPSGSLPAYLAGLYEVPLLTRQQEYHLFRKMNYLRYKASRLRKQLDPANPSPDTMAEIEKLCRKSLGVKNKIIRANLRLVVSVAKRYANGLNDLSELISDGNMSLIRAVEKFDYTRGFKFSTYATWALVRNYARTIPQELRHRSRFRNPPDEWLAATEDERGSEVLQQTFQAAREQGVRRILEHLNERERQVIRYRFGLEDDREPMTLRDVGDRMGISKERARQVESRAIAKLRDAARAEHLDVPDDP